MIWWGKEEGGWKGEKGEGKGGSRGSLGNRSGLLLQGLWGPCRVECGEFASQCNPLKIILISKKK